jgi:transketolase
MPQGSNEHGHYDAPGRGNEIDSVALAKAVRISCLKMTSAAGTSHIGSMFSIADIVAILYSRILRVDALDPQWLDRDRFVLSKGHAGAAIYVALAERGFFDRSVLDTYCRDGAALSGHISHYDVPGVELSTGSLGHGLGVSCGFALSSRLAKRQNRTFVLMSDGECDEGSNWEAALFAGHHKLSNLCAVIDYNKIQSLGSVQDTMALEPFADKWRSFNWGVEEVDGHDHCALEKALSPAVGNLEKPRCVIAHTVKGKGVSFMENSVLWHYRTARGDEFDRALAELVGGKDS